MPSTSRIDELIFQHLDRAVIAEDPNWTFRDRASRQGAHGLFGYPAMMVPAMQGELLKAVSASAPLIKNVLDPFVGSGTALTESMAVGLNFRGLDINPLAILVSQVKGGPFCSEMLSDACSQVDTYYTADRSRIYSFGFTNQSKWFRRSNSYQLHRIRRSIERIDNLHARRFCWLTLAETIRKVSNSRTSTYKLHLRPKEHLEELEGIASAVFFKTLTRNRQLLQEEAQRLQDSGRITEGNYNGDVKVDIGDIRTKSSAESIGKVDLVLTSPPYGDNRTTISYGQFSYLALNCIPLEDIKAGLTDDFLHSTNALDASSLGGKLRGARQVAEHLAAISPSFIATYNQLRKEDTSGNAANRWASYCEDLRIAVSNIVGQTRQAGYLIWIIGERSIRGVRVPLVQVLTDLHASAEAQLIKVYVRSIPSKRLPSKNDIGDLMVKESLCMFRVQRTDIDI